MEIEKEDNHPNTPFLPPRSCALCYRAYIYPDKTIVCAVKNNGNADACGFYRRPLTPANGATL